MHSIGTCLAHSRLRVDSGIPQPALDFALLPMKLYLNAGGMARLRDLEARPKARLPDGPLLHVPDDWVPRQRFHVVLLLPRRQVSSWSVRARTF